MASSICASGDGIHILIVYRYTRTLVSYWYDVIKRGALLDDSFVLFPFSLII